MRSDRCLTAIAAFVFLAAGCSHAPSDADIAARIKAAFFSDPLVKASALSVTVIHGEVTLAGTVTGSDVELQALKLTQETEGVRRLNDRISVVLPTEPLRQAAAAAAPAPRRGKSPAAASTPAAEPVAAPEPDDMAEAVRDLPLNPPAPRTFPRAPPPPAPVPRRPPPRNRPPKTILPPARLFQGPPRDLANHAGRSNRPSGCSPPDHLPCVRCLTNGVSIFSEPIPEHESSIRRATQVGAPSSCANQRRTLPLSMCRSATHCSHRL